MNFRLTLFAMLAALPGLQISASAQNPPLRAPDVR